MEVICNSLDEIDVNLFCHVIFNALEKPILNIKLCWVQFSFGFSDISFLDTITVRIELFLWCFSFFVVYWDYEMELRRWMNPWDKILSDFWGLDIDLV